MTVAICKCSLQELPKLLSRGTVAEDLSAWPIATFLHTNQSCTEFLLYLHNSFANQNC